MKDWSYEPEAGYVRLRSQDVESYGRINPYRVARDKEAHVKDSPEFGDLRISLQGVARRKSVEQKAIEAAQGKECNPDKGWWASDIEMHPDDMAFVQFLAGLPYVHSNKFVEDWLHWHFHQGLLTTMHRLFLSSSITELRAVAEVYACEEDPCLLKVNGEMIRLVVAWHEKTPTLGHSTFSPGLTFNLRLNFIHDIETTKRLNPSMSIPSMADYTPLY